MDKKELKLLIKPIIKECIRELLMEEGLRKVVSETVEPVAKAVQQVVTKPVQPQPDNKRLQEYKKKFLDEMGKKGYVVAGFDAFAGTKPITEGQSSDAVRRSALADIDPEDKGVDISSIIGNSAAVFKAINGGKK